MDCFVSTHRNRNYKGKEMMSLLIEEQIRREERMLDNGVLRYQKKEDKQTSKSKSNLYKNKIETALDKTLEGLTNDIAEVISASSGRRPIWLKDIEGLALDSIVFQALNCFVDAAGSGEKTATATLLNRIGKRIEAESVCQQIDKIPSREFVNKKGECKNFNVRASIKKEALEHSAVYEKRVAFAKYLAEKNGGVAISWSLHRRVHVATPVYNAILKYSDIFYIKVINGVKNTRKYVEFTPQALAEIEAQKLRENWMLPLWDVMLCPPRKWTSMHTGAYLTPRLSGLCKLVKQATWKQEQEVKNDFIKAKNKDTLPQYALALNALQEVPLKINQEIVSLVKWAWDKDFRIGKKFPTKKVFSEVERMSPEKWAVLDRQAKIRHISASKKMVSRNSEAKSNRDIMLRDLFTAEELADKTFYIPWNLDRRGRMYPLSSLNYHRDDHIKAMFLLKNGTKLDLFNDHWLRIHIANTGDFDKISKKSLDDRIQWVSDNEDFIIDIASDPKGRVEEWRLADKPFQFLSACIEYKNYMIATEKGQDYICHLAPAIDGQNSGCQHYSAASRDEKTGALVGLTPSKEPRDVYKKLADLVNAELQCVLLEKHKQKGETQEEFATRQHYAKKWLDFGVTRKHLKTNCMTYVYSSKRYGFQKQIQKEIMGEEDRDIHESGDSTREHSWGSEKEQEDACLMLARVSFSCVQQVLSSAKEGMEFFIALASALSKENKPVTWTTPIGFPVVQKYTKNNVVKVKAFLYDMESKLLKRGQVTLKNYRDKDGVGATAAPIDPYASRNGVSPNVIHSYDSSHMMFTILKLKEEGIHDFMMIHDSFSVLPEYSWILYAAVRDTFAEQYKHHCMYENLFRATKAKLSNPEVLDGLKFPNKGSLDLEAIRVCESIKEGSFAEALQFSPHIGYCFT